MSAPVRVSFICSGNICRSPTAEAILLHLVSRAGLSEKIEVDSAGLGSWHVGDARDRRSCATAARRGMPIKGVARQWQSSDFARFDYILAADAGHFEDLQAMAKEPTHKQKIHLLRAFDPQAPKGAQVPDPYYGGAQGFEDVFDMCLQACEGLLAHLRQKHNL